MQAALNSQRPLHMPKNQALPPQQLPRTALLPQKVQGEPGAFDTPEKVEKAAREEL